MMAQAKNSTQGKIIQIVGVVVDAAFEGSIPAIYDALEVEY